MSDVIIVWNACGCVTKNVTYIFRVGGLSNTQRWCIVLFEQEEESNSMVDGLDLLIL